MSTTPKTNVNIPTRPTPVQIQETTAATFASADAGASETLLNLQMVHRARLTQLNRTAATLKKQYGPDDPSVKAAEAAANAGTAKVARIAAVQQEVATPAPQVAADGWALHGRVYNSALKPLGKHTVFLVDAQKTYQEAYGFSYTDDTGYFLFNVAGAKNQDPAQAQTPLFLSITDTKGNPVFLSATPYQPTLGSPIYQNVTLPVGGQALGDPPAAIRNVALPSKKRNAAGKTQK